MKPLPFLVMKIRAFFMGRATSLLVALLIGFLIGGQFVFTFKFPSPSPSSSTKAFLPQQRKSVDPSNDILITTFESLQVLADEIRRTRSERPLSNLVEQLCEKVDVVSQLLDQLNCTKPHNYTHYKVNNSIQKSNHDKDINSNTNNEITKNNDPSNENKENQNNDNHNSQLNPSVQQIVQEKINPDNKAKNQPFPPGRYDPSSVNFGQHPAKSGEITPTLKEITPQPNITKLQLPTLKVHFNYTKDLPNKPVVIVVATSPDNFKRREGIRQTWVNYLKGTPHQDDFVYKFFLGLIEDPILKEQIEAERDLFGDIVLLDSFNDTYRNLSYKTIGMMRWAVDNYNTSYVLKLDDDTFLRLDRLMTFITKIPTEKYFVGYSFGPYVPYRERSNKWYVTNEEWPPGSIGPVLLGGGAGYLMTKDCAYVVGHRADDPTYKPLYIEDVNTALILREYGVTGVHDNLFYAFAKCTESRMTLHHINTPQKMKFLYKNSREKKTMCR